MCVCVCAYIYVRVNILFVVACKIVLFVKVVDLLDFYVLCVENFAFFYVVDFSHLFSLIPN